MEMRRLTKLLSALLVPAVLLAGGCMTAAYREEMTAEREDMLMLQEDVRRLSGRVEGVEMELQRLQGNIDTIHADHVRAANMQTRIDEVDARMRQLEAARERDKQEIIDALSAKISQVISSSSAAGTRRSARRHYSDTGYEHEVQPGESLSVIASAYGVSVQAIIDNNDIKDPDKLRAGQKLFIPQ